MSTRALTLKDETPLGHEDSSVATFDASALNVARKNTIDSGCSATFRMQRDYSLAKAIAARSNTKKRRRSSKYDEKRSRKDWKEEALISLIYRGPMPPKLADAWRAKIINDYETDEHLKQMTDQVLYADLMEAMAPVSTFDEAFELARKAETVELAL